MRLTVYSETFPRLMFQRGNHTAKRAAISIAFNAYGESRNTKFNQESKYVSKNQQRSAQTVNIF